jgi:CDP-paratose 2-epimerase
MIKKNILVTGSSGLIGSEVVSFFSNKDYEVCGIDNNQREIFFGPAGSTRSSQKKLLDKFPLFKHYEIDIRDRQNVLDLIKQTRPLAIIHTAAQPSHDRAAAIPFDDFDTNATGTFNLLEAARRYCKESPFIHLSTNKVYGDAPNKISIVEKETRWEYADDKWLNGIPETFTIDQSKHSLFGASKLGADIMVQEYGRYFNMLTCCLRGGCLTGPGHSGVELHGFLSYLIKCNIQSNRYTVYGYKAKQVRDNIHSWDVANFIWHFLKSPRVGEVYNLGGGKKNSISIMEAFKLIESISGKPMNFNYIEKAREGDHIVYYSDLNKIRSHYPAWDIKYDLNSIFEQIYKTWKVELKKNI